MQTLVILLAAAGVGAAIVWWATAPPATRPQRPPRRRPAPRLPRAARPPSRSFELPAPPQPVAEPSFEELVTVSGATVDDRPSRVFALLRLVMTIALVAALAVAVLAALWLVVNNQLSGYLR